MKTAKVRLEGSWRRFANVHFTFFFIQKMVNESIVAEREVKGQNSKPRKLNELYFRRTVFIFDSFETHTESQYAEVKLPKRLSVFISLKITERQQGLAKKTALTASTLFNILQFI